MVDAMTTIYIELLGVTVIHYLLDPPQYAYIAYSTYTQELSMR